MRLCMIEIDRVRSSGVSVWPFGACAFRTTSRPPCRSRPSTGLRYTGEPGTARRTAPMSAAVIAPISRRYLRRSLICRGKGSRASGSRCGAGGVRLGLFGRLELAWLGRGGGDDARDRAPRDAHVELGRDPDGHVLVSEADDLAVDAAGGDDLVADVELVQHP